MCSFCVFTLVVFASFVGFVLCLLIRVLFGCFVFLVVVDWLSLLFCVRSICVAVLLFDDKTCVAMYAHCLLLFLCLVVGGLCLVV